MKIRGILIAGVIMAVVLLVGTGFSGYLSNSAHNWVNNHGTGWVYVR